MPKDEGLQLPTCKEIDRAAAVLIESGNYTVDSVRSWAASFVNVRDENSPQDPEEILPSIY